MAGTNLGAYLNDHRAGAMAGSELAKSLRAKFEGTAQEAFFSELAADIEADLATLDALMERLDVEKDTFKAAAGWMVEKLSRLARNGLVSQSPQLTTLLEEETLSLGIEGKLALWNGLKTVADSYPPLSDADLDGLVTRAQSQLSGLERQRLMAAADALRP